MLYLHAACALSDTYSELIMIDKTFMNVQSAALSSVCWRTPPPHVTCYRVGGKGGGGVMLFKLADVTCIILPIASLAISIEG